MRASHLQYSLEISDCDPARVRSYEVGRVHRKKMHGGLVLRVQRDSKVDSSSFRSFRILLLGYVRYCRLRISGPGRGVSSAGGGDPE
jgi:hypothetical protein